MWPHALDTGTVILQNSTQPLASDNYTQLCNVLRTVKYFMHPVTIHAFATYSTCRVQY